MSSVEARAPTHASVAVRVFLGSLLARNTGLSAVAMGALLLGVLVYMVDRAPGQGLLMSVAGALAGGPSFGAWGNWLPSFVHPLAFGLFTAVLLPTRSAWRVGGCVLWGAVDAAFELGQHVRVSAPLAALLLGDAGPSVSSGRQALASYFLGGTYDTRDLVAAVLGAAAAVALLSATARRMETLHAS